jgi:hypothetical protein
MNWYLVSYILACIMIGFTGTYLLVSTGRSIGALTFFVGAITVFVIFGLRWFKYGANPFAPNSWPPVINTCPDYLVFYNRTGATGSEPTCIDVMGVSTEPSRLSKWPADGPAPTDERFFFSLNFNQTGVNLMAEKCARAIEKGLTWEGISNGESCYTWSKMGGDAAAESGSTKCIAYA